MDPKHETLSGGTLRIRVSPSLMTKLQSAAAMDGRPFPDFVRSLLVEGVDIRDELTNLRRIILDRESPHETSDRPDQQVDQQTQAAVLETLLLLRQIVTPEHLRAAHADLRRSSVSPISLS